MATTRPAIPPTNLKERIAALEQRNAANAIARPTSPTMGAASVIGGNVPSAAGFRDKIAKFERKGGVPVPRGRFGLGAPPTSEGPRKQGELYGNRIPAPARHVSAGILSSVSPPGTSTSANSPATSPVVGDRRSFSLSSAMSDFSDDQPDYTPISSPTFAFPLESPESLASIAFTPDGSPSVSPNSDITSFHRPIIRGTSFQKALEIARNAEIAKLEAQDTGSSVSQMYILESEKDRKGESSEQAPVIVVSSEDTPVAGTKELSFQPHVLNDAAAPIPTPALVPEVTPEPETPLETPLIVEETASIQNPVVDIVSTASQNGTVLRSSPETVSETTAGVNSTTRSDEIKPPLPTFVFDSPSSAEFVQNEIPAHESSNPGIKEVGSAEEIEVSVLRQTSEPPAAPATEVPIETIKVPELVELVPPPQIVVHQSPSEPEHIEQLQDDFSTNAQITARKTSLSLNSELLDEESPMSPPLSSGDISATSLADALTNYFTPGAENSDHSFRTTTPPPLPSMSPLSPMATLAYDAPDSSDLTIDVPDPSSFLSPPVSGVAASSGGSSLSSITSTGSRPMSMIEMSPSHISRAMRMTPATSRGVPLFLPPNSAHTRKSDFIYFPPTPEAADTEFGAATLHKSSQSMSLGGASNRRGSELPLVDPTMRPTTFTAVVHGKVRETQPAPEVVPNERKKHVPETPQMKRVKRMTMMEPPLSPGQGELEALLAEAALLEDSLDRGELPSENVAEMALEENRRKEQEAAMAAANAKAAREKEAERKRAAEAAAQLQAKRDEPTSGRLKHTFLVPLSRARTAHSKQTSASHADTFPTKEDLSVRPKSAALPEKTSTRITREDPNPRTNQANRPATPENSTAQIMPQTPSKSPKPSRFVGFRRLGSMSRPSTIHGGSARHSQSTSSEFSEDSVPVVTPTDGNVEFGMAKTSPIDEFGHTTNGSTTSFPSLSPRKSMNSIGRATSFAGKMWSRARTRSGSSNLSSTSETPDDIPSLPTSIVNLPAIQLPHLPIIPAAAPLPERDVKVVQPPQRSTSLKHPMHLPPLPTELLPPLPAITSSAFFPTTSFASETSSDSLMPSSSDSTRPSSWTSMSSAGSLPSPLFDEAFFNAFPSVPDTTSAIPVTAHRNLSRNPSILAAVNERPSFDSALLSSAIHLASTHKSTNSSAPAPNNNPSRAPTPTPMPRRSGEVPR